jgi:spoIIIJ-associated protein
MLNQRRYENMSRSIELSAKTVEEAVNMAAKELNTEKENIDVEILEEGSKGLLGLIGSKSVRIKATIKEGQSKKFLQDVFELMGLNVNMEINQEGKDVNINLVGDNMGILIGHRGETLDALQYIANIVENKGREEFTKINLDVENYRRKREETLVRLANKMAEKVKKYRKSLTLEPMNAYERKVIHSTLQEDDYVKTLSIGEEPNRKVTIAMK